VGGMPGQAPQHDSSSRHSLAITRRYTTLNPMSLPVAVNAAACIKDLHDSILVLLQATCLDSCIL
jgi:hypothetical protein